MKRYLIALLIVLFVTIASSYAVASPVKTVISPAVPAVAWLPSGACQWDHCG
jgi:hypothetical protein